MLVPAEEGVADADAAVLVAGAGLEAALELELEVELELQAAAPTTRMAPTAVTRHRERLLIRRDIPAKRAIAPCRLSAVNSPVSGPPLHGAAGTARAQN